MVGSYWLKCLTMALLSQFKFPSPFTRAYLHSPQLVQEALETFNIGPFQADGELLCMCFLQPCDDPPRADGVGSRPWEAFRRVLEDLGEHSVETQSVIPSEQWKQWFLGLDERVQQMLPTWNAAFGKSWRRSPVGSHPTPSHPESMGGSIMIERCGNLGIDLHLLPNFNWRNGGTGGLPNQLPNGPLKRNYGNIGPTGLLATWPLMLRTSRQWRQ